MGDSLDTIKEVWGEFTQEPRHGELFLEPRRQPAPRGLAGLDLRYARAGGAGTVTEVQGRSLTINGRLVLRVGDDMEKVRDVFGEPEPGIVLTRGCGNPGPMKRWSYRRRGAILSFEVPNQSFWRDRFDGQAKANPGIKVSFEEMVRKEPLLHEVQGISIHLRVLE